MNPELIKSEHFITYSHKLLQIFVFKFQNLYGEYLVSHNVHNSLHLSDDVKKYGALDVFSAFKFENNMMFIKKLLQKSQHPLQQLTKRYIERENFLINYEQECHSKIVHKNEYSGGPLTFDFIDLNIKQYKTF